MMSSFFFLFITLFIIISDSESNQQCPEEILPPEHGSVTLQDGLKYKFACEEGYILNGYTHIDCRKYNPDEKPKCIKYECQDLPDPENGRVDCDEGPLVPGKTCRFSCFDGYRLEGNQQRRCKFNRQWSGGFTRCSPITKASYSESADDNNRFNERTTVSNLNQVPKNTIPSRKPVRISSCQNLGCEQLCKLEKGGPHCRCCPGYILNRNDNKTCRLNNPRNVNMDECLHQHKTVGHIELRYCPQGYIFSYDRNGCIEKFPQRLPASQPTSFLESCSYRNGMCQHKCTMKDSKTVVCDCFDGYILHENGKHCIDINECNMNNFDCSHSCVNILGSAKCECPTGFRLDIDRKTCIDINECLYDNRCRHYCNNTEGSYFCSCKPGYILIEGHKCEGCRKYSYWSYESNACVDCPRNSQTDSEGKTSIKDCICNPGYIGNPGEYITCEDINECTNNYFGCSDECVNTPGGAYCICPKGFMLDSDNKTCIDIDECRIKNGGCEGLCINTIGSFNCTCTEGFMPSNTDRYSCDDIDECAENNGGCEHICKNYRGGYYCACRDGYHLDSTLKNCTDIQCPKLPQPHFSHMNCSHEPEKNSYPVGAVCDFTCDKGFKIADNNKLKCRKNGTWKGKLPECKPESCPPLNVPEHGKVHPSSCSTQGAIVKQKCTFSCHAGYILDGFPVFACRNNLTWNKKDIPVCKLVKIHPIIECPQDIRVTLLEGESRHNVTIPEPTTNMENYEIHPSGVTVGEPVEFQVGETKVTFTTVSAFNETAQCEMTVTVLDEEPPTFLFCPDPIKIEGARGSGEFVTWDEPVVTDNVEVESIFSLVEPNRTLTPGTYFVEYVAKDSSGNIGTCSFDISIIRMNCSYLEDPDHGKANCMDWMFGKLCNPECEDGYMRDPADPLYYACDDTGVWEPNDFISDCLKYITAISSVCPDGFEFKKVEATGEEVCIECSSNAAWSEATRKCEK